MRMKFLLLFIFSNQRRRKENALTLMRPIFNL